MKTIPTTRLVLASRSPRRRRILADVGLTFDVIPADIDESRKNGESPVIYARRTACEKGQAVADQLAATGEKPWILSADTIVVLGDQVLEKPDGPVAAVKMLKQLRGRAHTVITGWAVGQQSDWIVRDTTTRVWFHQLTDEQVDRYVATGEGMDKAGAYAIQGIGSFLVERIEGNYFNVVGLPISHVVQTLIEQGVLTEFP